MSVMREYSVSVTELVALVVTLLQSHKVLGVLDAIVVISSSAARGTTPPKRRGHALLPLHKRPSTS